MGPARVLEVRGRHRVQCRALNRLAPLRTGDCPMAPQPDVHPSDVMLRDFSLGKLNDEAATRLMDHLECCADCRNRAAAIPDDSVGARSRASRAPEAKSQAPVSPEPSPTLHTGEI